MRIRVLQHSEESSFGILPEWQGSARHEIKATRFHLNERLPETAEVDWLFYGILALSTASGLLLVISSSVANDVYYKKINPQASEAKQLLVGRLAMVAAIIVAGYLGSNPPGFVAEVVALAFGLAAASFFPILRVSPRAFGAGRAMPIVARYEW